MLYIISNLKKTAHRIMAILLLFIAPVSRELSGPVTTAFAISASEFELKAVYLYQFTRFVEWPSTAFKSPDDDFVLCVLGDNPFGKSLHPIADRSYKGHSIKLRYPSSDKETSGCHVLYLDLDNTQRETAILNHLANKPVLTVSSRPGFVERGGNIGFLNIHNNVRFAINRRTSMQNGLESSAKLLELAVRLNDSDFSGGRP